MTILKILVTSQKGGVGKSTVSANLAAYFSRKSKKTTLLDFDTHGSSSKWLHRAPNVGVIVQHHILPLDEGSDRSALSARLHLRRASICSDVIISDLTWTDAIAGELMFEYDMVIVPTSVSEIELTATTGFLSRHRWVFDSVIHKSPTLLVCPTRVKPEQLKNNAFSVQRFPISFMLTPPILESQSAREMFEQGYLEDLEDDCGKSFREFAKAVEIANAMLEKKRTTSPAMHKKQPPPIGLNSRHSVLDRHQLQKKHTAPVIPKKIDTRDSVYNQIPKFLKRWISN